MTHRPLKEAASIPKPAPRREVARFFGIRNCSGIEPEQFPSYPPAASRRRSPGAFLWSKKLNANFYKQIFVAITTHESRGLRWAKRFFLKWVIKGVYAAKAKGGCLPFANGRQLFSNKAVPGLNQSVP